MKAVSDIIKSRCLSGFRANQQGHLGGYHVQVLENAFCFYFNTKYAVAMNSATSCLHAAMIACGIRPVDKVIVTPYSFVSSASCVLMVNGEPVFTDIKADTFCMDINSVGFSPFHTKAIIPVHLMGHPAEMDEIMPVARALELKVVEDCSQAIGAIYHGKKAGTIGDCGVFSFNQSKHINTGEGGILITNDNHIAEVARAVRNHAEISCPEMKMIGYNYRMCEIEAAMALEQFKGLDKDLEYRNELAAYMSEKLSQIEGLIPPVIKDDCTHSFYTYGVKYFRQDMHRNQFQHKLINQGIYFGEGYVKPIYQLPVFYTPNLYRPVVERMYRDCLMVTDIIKHPLTRQDIDTIVEAINQILS